MSHAVADQIVKATCMYIYIYVYYTLLYTYRCKYKMFNHCIGMVLLSKCRNCTSIRAASKSPCQALQTEILWGAKSSADIIKAPKPIKPTGVAAPKDGQSSPGPSPGLLQRIPHLDDVGISLGQLLDLHGVTPCGTEKGWTSGGIRSGWTHPLSKAMKFKESSPNNGNDGNLEIAL